MKVTMKDGSVLRYDAAQWVEYRDGVALLMGLGPSAGYGAPGQPLVQAVLSMASVSRIDVANPYVECAPTPQAITLTGPLEDTR